MAFILKPEWCTAVDGENGEFEPKQRVHPSNEGCNNCFGRARDVGFGSFSTELGRPRDVRFPSDSDRTADIASGPVRANERTRFAGARCTRSGASGTDGVTRNRSFGMAGDNGHPRQHPTLP